MTEFFAAIEGHNLEHGGGHRPMDREEYDDLLLKYGGPSKSIRKS